MAPLFNMLLKISLLGVFICLTNAADPDPLADFNASEVTTFTFRGLGENGVVSNSTGGRRSGLNTTLFPALKSQGITYVRFELEPCAVNEPHIHPRATELLVLVSGGPIQVGLVDTKSATHVDILYPGDVTVFPRGLMHYELNVGTERALFFSALNSENPGTLPVANALAQVPTRALIAALQTGDNATSVFQAAQPSAKGTSKLIKLDAKYCTPGSDLSTTN